MILQQHSYRQNLLSLAVFMMIICYYAFNGIPEDTYETQNFGIEKATPDSESIEFEKSISQLRGAILMEADDVQIYGLLYKVEVALGNLSSEREAKVQVLKIHDLLLNSNKRAAIKHINQLPTILLKKEIIAQK